MSLTKTDAITEILTSWPNDPIVFTTGYACRIAATIADRPTNFYMTGSMGLSLLVGLGIARASGRRTLVVDGDGSLVMNPSGLIDAAAHKGAPVIHMVLDDGVYDSTGGQRSSARDVDFRAWAEACRIPTLPTVSNELQMRLTLEIVAKSIYPVLFVRCLIVPDRKAVPPRIARRLPELAQRFRTHAVQPASGGLQVDCREPVGEAR